ncbi:hypothetical protein DPMN_031981 [Dreissena polymorpha]|uniref:Uncharacterized protein n=1 Tax=Dreissena polymorpha TaxID=45954 RepID=A0A9D4M449_DREPO|nr:hypothetical protein DPMN_031981 [Dreissena polymorpha]
MHYRGHGVTERQGLLRLCRLIALPALILGKPNDWGEAGTLDARSASSNGIGMPVTTTGSGCNKGRLENKGFANWGRKSLQGAPPIE